MKDSISGFMTASPVTIGCRASLTAARERMNQHGVRHLPVMHGGDLVGVLSQRDIQLLESLPSVDPAEALVEEAMSLDVLVVDPDTALSAVAPLMAKRKCGSAVVVRDGEVLGIFTTIDALHAIEVLLREKGVRKAVRRVPSSRARSISGS
ncbi:MAG: CBS domain-containing protein [Myxococcaceae bacterium]|nr:CBS domain-containing protein [Myxococcaceae bacterium]